MSLVLQYPGHGYRPSHACPGESARARITQSWGPKEAACCATRTDFGRLPRAALAPWPLARLPQQPEEETGAILHMACGTCTRFSCPCGASEGKGAASWHVQSIPNGSAGGKRAEDGLFHLQPLSSSGCSSLGLRAHMKHNLKLVWDTGWARHGGRRPLHEEWQSQSPDSSQCRLEHHEA